MIILSSGIALTGESNNMQDKKELIKNAQYIGGLGGVLIIVGAIIYFRK